MSSSNFSQRWSQDGWVPSALPKRPQTTPFTPCHENSDSLNCSVWKQLYVLDTHLTHIMPLYPYRSLFGLCQFFI